MDIMNNFKTIIEAIEDLRDEVTLEEFQNAIRVNIEMLHNVQQNPTDMSLRIITKDKYNVVFKNIAKFYSGRKLLLAEGCEEEGRSLKIPDGPYSLILEILENCIETKQDQVPQIERKEMEIMIVSAIDQLWKEVSLEEFQNTIKSNIEILQNAQKNPTDMEYRKITKADADFLCVWKFFAGRKLLMAEGFKDEGLTWIIPTGPHDRTIEFLKCCSKIAQEKALQIELKKNEEMILGAIENFRGDVTHEQFQNAIKMNIKILQNVQQHPTDMQYRTIMKRNVDMKVFWIFTSGANLLEAEGLKHEGKIWKIPAGPHERILEFLERYIITERAEFKQELKQLTKEEQLEAKEKQSLEETQRKADKKEKARLHKEKQDDQREEVRLLHQDKHMKVLRHNRLDRKFIRLVTYIVCLVASLLYAPIRYIMKPKNEAQDDQRYSNEEITHVYLGFFFKCILFLSALCFFSTFYITW